MTENNQIDLSDPKYSRIIIFRISKFNNLSKNIVKKIKIFYQRVINEQFHHAKKDDPIWIALLSKNENEDPKSMREMFKLGCPIIGICMLTSESPYRHFDNEENMNVPYLYNMMVDIKNPITRELKVAPILLTAVKDNTQNIKQIWTWLNPNNPSQPKSINIDVMYKEEGDCSKEFYEKSQHALKFYKKNGFVECREKPYEMKDGEGTIFRFTMMNFAF